MNLTTCPVKIIFSLFMVVATCSCNNDENEPGELPGNPDETNCENSQNLIYEEKDGLVVAEFESLKNSNDWSKENTISGFLGSHYLLWKGDAFNNNPGNGLLVFKIKITNPGKYRFLWRSRIAMGNSGTEHNDSWLRFADADDFFGQKNDSFVYPGDTGQSPTPNGSSKDGWFKIYMNGTGQWKWQSSTSDNDAHNIFVTFDSPGMYTMEVSARSSFHALDRFVLFSENVNQSDAIDSATMTSKITCN